MLVWCVCGTAVGLTSRSAHHHRTPKQVPLPEWISLSSASGNVVLCTRFCTYMGGCVRVLFYSCGRIRIYTRSARASTPARTRECVYPLKGSEASIPEVRACSLMGTGRCPRIYSGWRDINSCRWSRVHVSAHTLMLGGHISAQPECQLYRCPQGWAFFTRILACGLCIPGPGYLLESCQTKQWRDERQTSR